MPPPITTAAPYQSSRKQHRANERDTQRRNGPARTATVLLSPHGSHARRSHREASQVRILTPPSFLPERYYAVLMANANRLGTMPVNEKRSARCVANDDFCGRVVLAFEGCIYVFQHFFSALGARPLFFRFCGFGLRRAGDERGRRTRLCGVLSRRVWAFFWWRLYGARVCLGTGFTGWETGLVYM